MEFADDPSKFEAIEAKVAGRTGQIVWAFSCPFANGRCNLLGGVTASTGGEIDGRDSPHVFILAGQQIVDQRFPLRMFRCFAPDAPKLAKIIQHNVDI
jgi:hypothetical protein